jgi:hypothetical protein
MINYIISIAMMDLPWLYVCVCVGGGKGALVRSTMKPEVVI